jgi:HlyD family secretion protein
MKRVLLLVALLTAALVVTLLLRVSQLRAASHGPAGGSGVIEGVDVNVTSRIATRISTILVREGDSVRQGQLVAELDCAQQRAALDQAEAQLHAAEASFAAATASAQSAGRSASAAVDNIGASRSQVAAVESQADLARIELERVRRLAESGALGQSSLDEAQSRYDTLLHQVAAQKSAEGASRAQADALHTSTNAATAQALAAQSNVETARAAIARAKVDVDECRLLAPRDAMVATRILEPGEVVAPGTAILALTDVTEARTRFYLPNGLLAAAAPGRKVRVVADAYPGQSFEGTIYYVSPSAEFTPRNVQTREDRERLVYAVEVRIPNADMRLRSGMPVEVAIEGTWR